MDKKLSTQELTPLLNYKRAADYLNISISTLQHMVGRNEITFYKIGGSIRFQLSDLDEFRITKK